MQVRLVREDDFKALRGLVMRYLKDTYEQGGDFLPTLENAAAFTQHAIDGAKAGDPCVVGVDGEKLMGFVIARGIVFPGMQTREKTIRSWGSYVLPEYRGQRCGITMFMLMGRLARMAGYTRLLGMTHGSGYEENSIRAIKAISNVVEVGKVLVVDLVRKEVPSEVHTHE